MSTKAKYCAIFGLKETASKDEIRKAYRKLAMKYHPDRNSDPKAHQVFIDLAEAYELLMSDKFENEKKNIPRNEKSFEERKKEAEIRYREQKLKEQKEEEYYFAKLTSGLRWKIFTYISKFAILFACILLIETFLPRHLEEHTITHYSSLYSGIFDGEVISFKTNKDLKLFIKNPDVSMSTTHPDIIIERSWFFHNPVKIWSKDKSIKKHFETDFSVLSIFPIVPLLFLVPQTCIRFKRKSVKFTFAYLFSFYIIGTFVCYFILSQDRWIHLLSLGFL